MPAKIIATAIHKGGTGKTICTIHLVHFLASKGHQVLLVDFDTQGNATRTFVDEPLQASGGTSSLFTNGSKPTLLDSFTPNVKVLPADKALRDVDAQPAAAIKRFKDNLRRMVDKLGFDYVVIDTPPTTLMGMRAPLAAADFAYSPFRPDRFSYEGVDSLHEEIKSIQDSYNPELVYLGLLINAWNKRNSDHNSVVEALQSEMPDRLIPHTISDRTPIGRVAFTRLPVWNDHSGSAGVATKELRAALSWITKQMEKSK